jgi:hypothetical protein
MGTYAIVLKFEVRSLEVLSQYPCYPSYIYRYLNFIRMKDSLRPTQHSHDVDKKEQDISHLEMVPSHTPPGEVEKGQKLAPIVSNGPVVHEKVTLTELPPKWKTDFEVDECKVVHDFDLHVVLVDWLANPAVSLRLRPSHHLPRHWWC